MSLKIVVTVETPRGREPLEVEIDTDDVALAKRAAVKHLQTLGYENVELGFPDRKKKRKKRQS